MCDTLVSLTDDGVLFAKNSDREPNESQLVEWHPAADHTTGGSLHATWIEIPQVARTHAIAISRPWWMWGAEMGANEHGVVIGNQAVFTKEPVGHPALLGMDLVRLGLERAASAEEAIGVIVELLETHGQGGSCSYEHPGFTYHNSFIVADGAGAIVLETAGRLWATEHAASPTGSPSPGSPMPMPIGCGVGWQRVGSAGPAPRPPPRQPPHRPASSPPCGTTATNRHPAGR